MAAFETTHRSEVTLVEGQDLVGVVPLGEEDEGGVGEPDVEVEVRFHDVEGHVHIDPSEFCELVLGLVEFGEETSRAHFDLIVR